MVFAMHHGYLPPQIDHINCDCFDNRIENLRPATNAENHWNTGLRKTNKSGVKGVHWGRQSKKWIAECRFGGRIHHIGSFVDLAVAAEAIKQFRIEHHGEYARHATSNGIGDAA